MLYNLYSTIAVGDLIISRGPAELLERRRDQNREEIDLARETLNEIEEFLVQWKIYLAILEKVQVVLDREKIEK